MFLKQLCLNNFRLFPFINLEFANEINVLSGLNGRGKTSILEAIHYLALTKSFRAHNDSTAVKFDCNFFEIRGEVISDQIDKNDVRVYYSHTEGKNFFINGKKVLAFSEVIGIVPCVVLTMDDLNLLFGVPGERRRFIDIVLAQTSAVYLENLKLYRRALQQRNALLATENKNLINNQMEIWNTQIITYGTQIIAKRLEFINFLNANLTEYYNSFAHQGEIIKVVYKTNIFQEEKFDNLGQIEKLFRKKLEKIFDFECQKKKTVVGPHRDDLDFMKDLKSFRPYCSQGESKMLTLSLKFAEWKYLMLNKGKKPILLLDDVFGELDSEKLQVVLTYVFTMGQSFITTTGKMEFVKNLTAKNYVFDHAGVYAL